MALILTGKAWKNLVLRRQPQPVLVCIARHPNAKREPPVDFDSTTEEEQEDEVDFQVNLTLTYLIFTRTHSLQDVATLYNIFVLEM